MNSLSRHAELDNGIKKWVNAGYQELRDQISPGYGLVWTSNEHGVRLSWFLACFQSSIATAACSKYVQSLTIPQRSSLDLRCMDNNSLEKTAGLHDRMWKHCGRVGYAEHIVLRLCHSRESQLTSPYPHLCDIAHPRPQT